jgi:hypothetical protein
MMCVGRYEVKPHIYEKFIGKKQCIHTNGKLENGLIYLFHITGRSLHCQVEHHVQTKYATLILHVKDIFKIYKKKSTYT